MEVSIAKKSLTNLMMVAALTGGVISMNISAKETDSLVQSHSTKLQAGQNRVTFKSFGVDLVGNLYLPKDFDRNKKYKAIVGASPFPQVKEQTLAIYGEAMAERGFVFLAFDYLATGESPALPGEHMQSRNMFRMIENTWDAVSYLGSLPFVDEVNALGVCQGGATIASSVVSDYRIKKFVTVAGIMAMDEAYSSSEVREFIMNSANKAKQEMYETGQPVYANLNGFRVGDETTLEEAKAMHPNNHDSVEEYYSYYGMGGVGGLGEISTFTHSQLADTFMTSTLSISESYADKIVQPSLVIYGEKSPLAFASINFAKKLTNDHEVLALPDYSQIDFYYKPEVVKTSADAAADFFMK